MGRSSATDLNHLPMNHSSQQSCVKFHLRNLMEILSIKQLLDYSLFVKLLEYRASDAIIETSSTCRNREVWLLGHVYIVISNERHTQQWDDEKPEANTPSPFSFS